MFDVLFNDFIHNILLFSEKNFLGKIFSFVGFFYLYKRMLLLPYEPEFSVIFFP